jgi:molecular chaperone GrpE
MSTEAQEKHTANTENLEEAFSADQASTTQESTASDAEEAKKKEEESFKEQYLRLCATFENYKKRIDKDMARWLKQANKEILTNLLPVLDDLELALEQQANSEPVKKAFEGIALIHKKLQQLIKDHGLEVIDVDAGDPFNPDLHEALTTMPASDEAMKNTIAQVVNKGYKQGEDIFRFVKVIVYA